MIKENDDPGYSSSSPSRVHLLTSKIKPILFHFEMDSDRYKQDRNIKLMVMIMIVLFIMMTMVIMITLMIVMMTSWLERVWTWGTHEYSKKQLPGLIGPASPHHHHHHHNHHYCRHHHTHKPCPWHYHHSHDHCCHKTMPKAIIV